MVIDGDRIKGVEVDLLDRFKDSRGWLVEMWRNDGPFPSEMAYMSVTMRGQSRGPHEHVDQTDMFIFPGYGRFEFRMWDNREDSSTHGVHMRFVMEYDSIVRVVVPPGVVHGYKCVGTTHGIVINLPDKLYGGEMQLETVDEIRHEDSDSPYSME